MATMQEFQARMQAAVRETVQKVLAEGDLPEGAEGAALFTVIENLALAAGDAVSREVFEQQLSELAATERPADGCPQCGRVGRQVKKRSREITTRRGLAVPLAERECYCTGCRRSFFPSESSARAGRGLRRESGGLSEDRAGGDQAGELRGGE
jgi:hypothetical protein